MARLSSASAVVSLTGCSYAHLFANDATLNQNAGSTGAYGLLNGEPQSDINLLGVQLSVNF